MKFVQFLLICFLLSQIGLIFMYFIGFPLVSIIFDFIFLGFIIFLFLFIIIIMCILYTDINIPVFFLYLFHSLNNICSIVLFIISLIIVCHNNVVDSFISVITFSDNIVLIVVINIVCIIWI